MTATSLDVQIAMVVRRLAATIDVPPAAIEIEVEPAFAEWETVRRDVGRALEKGSPRSASKRAPGSAATRPRPQERGGVR